MNRIIFAASDFDGGGRVRSMWPAETLRARGWDAVAAVGWPDAADGDTVVVHRPLDVATLERVRRYRDAGARVLVDEDDDLTCIPASNLFRIDADGMLQHARAIGEADGLLVTTRELERIYGPVAQRCWLVPNALPAWLGKIRSTVRPDGRVRVGWAGGVNVHRDDLRWLAPVAATMLRDVVFTTVGDMRTPRTLGFGGTVEVEPWQTDPRRLYKLMARADIGIVPLEPNQFNRSKSGLKALEFLSLGKPVVATDLPEQHIIVDGVTGFLASTPAEFASAVRRLVEDPILRLKMGEAARQHAARLTLEQTVGAWETALRVGVPV